MHTLPEIEPHLNKRERSVIAMSVYKLLQILGNLPRGNAESNQSGREPIDERSYWDTQSKKSDRLIHGS